MPDITDDTLDLGGGFEKATGAVQEKDIHTLIGPEEVKFFKEYIGISEDQIVSHVSKAVSANEAAMVAFSPKAASRSLDSRATVS